MPSFLHETLVEMFQERPALAADLLVGKPDMKVPRFEKAHLSSSTFTRVVPTEYRADAVVTLDDAFGTAMAVIVEVQLKVDKHKRRTWPVYVATLHARLDCPVVLLAVCPDQAVADTYNAPIVIAPDSLTLNPVVFGPNQLPVVTDTRTARAQPQLTVLSALAHCAKPDREPIFHALLTALDVVDPDNAEMYTDLVFAVLPEAARSHLEEFMTTAADRYHSDFARRYFSQGEARGRAEGEARAVLAVLQARGIEVPDEVRTKIIECTDLDQLETWVRRAVTAQTIEDLDR